MEWEIKDGNIGYIKVHSFSNGISEKAKKALSEFDKKYINKVVIDLCDNPGGEEKELIEMFNLFAPEGVVLHTFFVDEKNIFYSHNKNFGKYRIIILVNENSASAAEAFAGTMKDMGAAVIVGKRTFGKGTVTRLKEEKRGQGIVKTVGMYTTATNKKINGVGVSPDIEADEVEMYSIARNILSNRKYGSLI